MSDEIMREINRLKAANEDIKSVNRRIIATLVRLEGKVDDMAERMATKDDLAALESKLTAQIDGLAGKVADFSYSLAVHARLLDEHDSRLKKLEPKRS